MARLASRVWIDAVRRLVDRDGGFAAIVRRGDAEAGDIMIVLHERGEPAALLSRAIGGDGWARESLPPESLAARLERARARDPDLWILELDVADAERLIVSLPSRD